MQYIQGDILTEVVEVTDMLVTPANAVINKGKLVMGAGFAKYLKEFGEANGVDIPQIAGDLITKQKMPSIYGFVHSGKLGFMQVKNHYSETGSLLLLNYGLKQLADYCEANPNKRVDMPFPCVGLGGLTIEEVKPLLDSLLKDTQVNIWHL